MPSCTHGTVAPAVFELATAERSMRYIGSEGVLGAASTFGGRWRVTGPDGEPLFSLAPAGAPGTDDRDVVPHGGIRVATIMRDRRQGDSWIVRNAAGELALRATRHGAYELRLTDPEGVLLGRIWATATAVIVDFGTPPDDIHCLALALPLYFATTGALRVDSLDRPTPSLPLWS